MHEKAAEAFATLRIISDLLRHRVSPDLRSERITAANIVIAAEEGNQSRAAQRLGVNHATLNNLINNR